MTDIAGDATRKPDSKIDLGKPIYTEMKYFELIFYWKTINYNECCHCTRLTWYKYACRKANICHGPEGKPPDVNLCKRTLRNLLCTRRAQNVRYMFWQSRRVPPTNAWAHIALNVSRGPCHLIESQYFVQILSTLCPEWMDDMIIIDNCTRQACNSVLGGCVDSCLQSIHSHHNIIAQHPSQNGRAETAGLACMFESTKLGAICVHMCFFQCSSLWSPDVNNSCTQNQNTNTTIPRSLRTSVDLPPSIGAYHPLWKEWYDFPSKVQPCDTILLVLKNCLQLAVDQMVPHEVPNGLFFHFYMLWNFVLRFDLIFLFVDDLLFTPFTTLYSDNPTGQCVCDGSCLLHAILFETFVTKNISALGGGSWVLVYLPPPWSKMRTSSQRTRLCEVDRLRFCDWIDTQASLTFRLHQAVISQRRTVQYVSFYKQKAQWYLLQPEVAQILMFCRSNLAVCWTWCVSTI